MQNLPRKKLLFLFLPILGFIILITVVLLWKPKVREATKHPQRQSTKTASVSADPKPASIEKFIVANPFDLAPISMISKFRSCAGHDYSGTNVSGEIEKNRSMKHYLEPTSAFVDSVGKVKVFAPFDGEIIKNEKEQVPRGKQVHLTSNTSDGWIFIFFHIDLLPDLDVNSKVKAGQLIGHANLKGGSFDATLKKFADNSPQPALESIFNKMTVEVLAEFQKKGVTTNNIIISKSSRDAKPCSFGGPRRSEDFVTLK